MFSMETFVYKEFKQMFHWCPIMKISAAQWALAGSCLLTMICLMVQIADYHVGLFSHDVFLTFKIFYLVLLCLSLFSTSCSLIASRRPFSTSDPLSLIENLEPSSSFFNFFNKCGCTGLFPRRFVLLIATVLFSLIALAISLIPGTHHDQEDHLAAKQILQVLQTLSVGISVYLNVRDWLDSDKDVQNLDKLSLEAPEEENIPSPTSSQRQVQHTQSEQEEQYVKTSDGAPLVNIDTRKECTVHERHLVNGNMETESIEENASTLVNGNIKAESVGCHDSGPVSIDLTNKDISKQKPLFELSSFEENLGQSGNSSEAITDFKTVKADPDIKNETSMDVHPSECIDTNLSKNTSITYQVQNNIPSFSTSMNISQPHSKPHKITEHTVMDKTENLAEKYKLNVSAGTSTLYRYSDNTCIVKVLQENIPQEMFNNEIKFFNHPDFFNSPHLVKLKFYATSKSNSKRKYLISEHISPGKDLNRWLYTARESLRAVDRFNILLGISKGLNLIHNNHIIHNDIKPANIIIDGDRKPKILDFSSIHPTPECTLSIVKCEEMLGTPSYMGPERLANKGEESSTKSDTFSFGVLLLEVLSGRDPAKYHDDDDLPTWVYLYRESGQSLRGILDTKTDGGWSHVDNKVIEDLVDIGLTCTNSKVDLRPDMYDVEKKLRHILLKLI